MDFSEIQYEKHDRVAKVTLNRPHYRNPIGRITIEEIDQAFADAADDDGIGAIVLCARGDHFSAGHDIGTPEKQADDENRPFPEGTRGQFHRSWYLYIEHGLRWRNLPKPTIGVIQGKCIWGGWMLATTMDILFAAEDARFLGSNFQYFSVPWDVGIRKAKEILFEPRFITAREAQDLGFVNRVFPDHNQALDEAMAYAARVATNSIFNLRMTKLNINMAQDMQGYTNHILAAHTKPGGTASSQGMRLKAGERRVAPVPQAEENLANTRGIGDL
ncbi:MAG: enoyl-CoA hydratase-related protein [Pseudomonadota bacterium]